MDSYQLESEEIRMPIGRAKLFFKDYFHRKYTIDFHIKLRKWAKKIQIELCFFDTYFDKIGNNRKNKNLKAKTKLDVGNSYLIADAVF